MPFEKMPNPPVLSFAFTDVKNTSLNNFSARCRFCLLEKRISFNSSSPSNLRKHLQRVHTAKYEKFILKQRNKTSVLKGPTKSERSQLPTTANTFLDAKTKLLQYSANKEEPLLEEPSRSSISSIERQNTETIQAEKSADGSDTIEQPHKNITTSSCSVQSHSEEDKQLIESTDPIISTKISNKETSISVPASSDQKLACQPSESDSAKKTGNESGRKEQSILSFVKKECSCCNKLKTIDKCMRFSLKAMLRNCGHKQEDCCCKQTYESMTNLQCDEVEQEADVNYNDVFAYQFDPNLNATKVICIVCLRAGYSKSGRKRCGDYSWATGIVFENKRRENQDKKRHLKSICHLEAAQSLNSFDKEQIRKRISNKSAAKRMH